MLPPFVWGCFYYNCGRKIFQAFFGLWGKCNIGGIKSGIGGCVYHWVSNISIMKSCKAQWNPNKVGWNPRSYRMKLNQSLSLRQSRISSRNDCILQMRIYPVARRIWLKKALAFASAFFKTRWRDLNRPTDYESTGLNSPFDTLNIGLYNVFFGRHWPKR